MPQYGRITPENTKEKTIYEKQDQIYGYPSRVRVGRGRDEIDQPSSWAGAVIPKKLNVTDRPPTDQPTNRQTDRAVESRVHATKKKRNKKLDCANVAVAVFNCLS